MTLDALLPHVKQRGSRYSAICPAHADRTPSLSVSDGDKGVLLKCWARCTVEEICRSLGIEQRDLFFDALDTDPQRRREAIEQRERQNQERERKAYQDGALIDALREAEYFVRSRQRLDISTWSDEQLDAELNSLADACHLLEHEDLDGCPR